MFKIDILTLFAFFGTFQALVFSVNFWLKNKNVSNKIFSFLLLATSIRIAKNIFVHLKELNPEMFSWYELWRTLVYSGLSHQFAIGPLFLLYFQSKLNPKFNWRKKYLWHFLLYFLLMLISPFVQWSFWRYGGLLASYVSILVYYLWTIWVFHNSDENTDHGTRNWLKLLLMVVALMLISYSPALFYYMGYVGGAFLYAIAILSVGYIMLSNSSKLSLFHTKYESTSINKKEIQEIKIKLENAIKHDKLFIDPELTMQSLAKHLEIGPHKISQVVNKEFNMSFTDYLNSFRLEEATKRLKDPKYSHLKISALAYDCGFNSVPTFNTLFKKTYKVTPTQFRRN